MGMFYGHSIPRSAEGVRGRDQDGACFMADQCETYVLARVSGASSPHLRWIHLDLPLGGHLVHHLERGYPRWAVSLLKLDNGAWVSGWMGCWVAEPHYIAYPDRESALQEIALATIRQAWRQYRTIEVQRLLIGIEADELEAVTSWAVGLLDRPAPKRVKRAQRRTLFETRQEA